MTEKDSADRPADPPHRDLPARAGDDRPVSPSELERVMRRAANLQFRAGEEGDDLPAGEVVRIGEEVGLDARYVRQALAELHAEALIPSRPEESAVAVRLFGPSSVRASRVVPGTRGEVEMALTEHFRDGELLKQVRARPGSSLWEPAGGVVATMKRSLDVSGRGYELAKARNIEVGVHELEPGWSLITLTADLGNRRTEQALGWFLGLGAAAVPAAIFLVAAGGPGLPILLGAALTGGAAFGTATFATNAMMRRQRARMELALHGVLDRLEGGEALQIRDDDPPPRSKGPDWWDNLRSRLLDELTTGRD